MCLNKQNSKICTSVSVILNIFPKILPFSTTFMCEAFHDITWEVLNTFLLLDKHSLSKRDIIRLAILPTW